MHDPLKFAIVVVWMLAEAVLTACITTYGQLEQLRMLCKDRFLELEHQQRVNNWSRLWPTSVDALVSVLYLVGLPEGLDLIYSVSLAKHHL